MFRNQIYVQSTTCVIMYVLYLFCSLILSQFYNKSQIFFASKGSWVLPSKMHDALKAAAPVMDGHFSIIEIQLQSDRNSHIVSLNFTTQMSDTATLYYQLTYAKF